MTKQFLLYIEWIKILWKKGIIFWSWNNFEWVEGENKEGEREEVEEEEETEEEEKSEKKKKNFFSSHLHFY